VTSIRSWLPSPCPVLFYNESKHPRHPWQAKKFKNETGITLGKGVAIVLNAGEFTGKAVLESAPPNEEAILIHALENGVKVFVEHGQVESRFVRFNISNGVVLYESITVSETVYKISNQKAVAFRLEIEHHQQLHGGDEHKFEVTSSSGQVSKTQTVSGACFGVDLPANSALLVTVRETQVQEQSIELQDGFEAVGHYPHLLHGSQGRLSWLVQNLVNSKHPLASNRQLQACIAAQQELEQAAKKIQEALYQVQIIEQEQERLKGLIPVTHSGDSNELKTQVAENEKRWRELKRATIPVLHEAIRTKAAALQEALGNLSVSWSEDSGGNGDTGGLRGAFDKFARAFSG